MGFGIDGRCCAVGDRLCRKKIDMGTKEYSTIEAMEHCTVPILFIHGTDDTFVPVTMTYENYQVCTVPKQLLIVPGAGHGLSCCVEKRCCEAVMQEFWNIYDVNTLRKAEK